MSTGRLVNKLALVTGGASGIGRATAILLAQEGATVAVADRDELGAEETAAIIQSQGGKATGYPLEVTSERSWDELASVLPNNGKHLDIVVNSAGISHGNPIIAMSAAEWNRVLAVNLTGVFLGTRFAMRSMQERQTGSIVNVSSGAGVKAIPGASAYSVSKAGVCMFTRVAALECATAGWKVRVNSVLPGGVKTPLWRQMDFFADIVGKTGSETAAFDALGQNVPLKRYAEPEEIARAILYLASDDSAYITGTELVIDGGWTT
jgi:3(or 17)beta-hydroxysteroid dehydrogenase